MEKLSKVVGYELGPEDERAIAALVEKAKARGVDEEFLTKVLRASESLEDTIADLTVLAEPNGTRMNPKLPPLPPELHERELEAFEEEIFERIISGQCEPQRIV